MGNRVPAKLSPNLTLIGPTSEPEQPKPSGENGGCIALAVLAMLVFLLVKCSASGDSPSNLPSASQDWGNSQEALSSAVASQAPPPVESLNATALKLGTARVTQAAVEGLAGEVIYSQNCYDKLAREFSWKKLDECGSFDVEAGLSLEKWATEGASAELEWLQSEAVAGRYLKAAIAAGQEADAADRRYSALQAQVRQRHGSRSRAKPAPEVERDPVVTSPSEALPGNLSTELENAD